MHVAFTIDSLSRSTGGPATVVQHLSDHLVQQGVKVTVLTKTNASEQSEILSRDQRVKVVRISTAAGTSIGRELKQTLASLQQNEQLNLVHDFGMWLPANHAVASACRELNISWVNSPSGMLAPWALRHKAWKKRIAWWLYQRKDLSRASVLIATAPSEAKDIQRELPGKSIALIPNGVDIPEKLPMAYKPLNGQKRKLVFLGRIHPVKGLKNLIEAWHQVRPVGWQCVLAGPNEAGHRQELEQLLKQHGLAADFSFPGMLDDPQKWKLLGEADLFVLPSFTENFGVSVAEALAAQVPVITTQGTPWQELPERKCGWWVEIGANPLEAALREATSLSVTELQTLGERGRQLVEEKYAWTGIASELAKVYQWVLQQGPKPACIYSN